MTRTFREFELQEQKQAASKRRRLARRSKQRDPFCAYLLGTLDEEGNHAQATEPSDRAIQIARRIMSEG